MKKKLIPLLLALVLVLTGCSLAENLLEVIGSGKKKDHETAVVSEVISESVSASEETGEALKENEEPAETESQVETEQSEEQPEEEISRIEVADVRGMTRENATQTLEAQGFTVESEVVESEEAEPDTVVSQSPVGYDLLEPGSVVKIYLTPEKAASSKVRMDEFPLICQYPELPTGCEITSLTMVLNYMGYSADRFVLSDYYLKKGPVGTVDFREAFEGDPRDGSSYGCYAPVIVNTANSYLSDQESSQRAVDLTGSSLQELFSYIDVGTPVVVWATYDCNPGHYSVTWYVNGQNLTWYTPEHVLVLVGYDEEYVYLANPAYGAISTYTYDLFNARYQELGCQAVIIQ